MSHERELVALVDGLRFHTVRQVSRPAGGGAAVKVPALDDLLVRAQRLLRVGSSVSARADGFGSRTPLSGSPGGGKGGRAVMAVPDGDGGVDLVPTSSTEVAAVARKVADPIALLAHEAWVALRRAAGGLEELARVLDRWERLQSTALVPDPPMCWVAQSRGLVWDLVWEPWRTTDFAGVLAQPLDEPRKVSQPVYWFVRNHRRLPEKTELVAMLERASVKVRG